MISGFTTPTLTFEGGTDSTTFVRCVCGLSIEALDENIRIVMQELANPKMVINPMICGCDAEKKIWTLPCRGFSAKSPEYKVWLSLRQACSNRNSPRWKSWGAKGIRMTSDWGGRRKPEDVHLPAPGMFLRFLKDVGMRPSDKHVVSIKPGAKILNRETAFWKIDERSRGKGVKSAERKMIMYRGEMRMLSDICKVLAGSAYTTPEVIRRRIERGCPEGDWDKVSKKGYEKFITKHVKRKREKNDRTINRNSGNYGSGVDAKACFGED